MSGSDQGDGATPSQVEPDAVGRGWIEQVGATREQVLFMLAGPSLGIGDLLGGSLPEWFDLSDTTNLDAVGDPVGGMQPVEMTFSSGRVLRAGWPVAFCDRVVDSLMGTIADAPQPSAPAPAVSTAVSPAPTPASASDPMPPADAPIGSVTEAAVIPIVVESTAPASAQVEAGSSAPSPAVTPNAIPTGPVEPALPSGQPTSLAELAPPAGVAPVERSAADAAGQGAAALVLEDVTYLGGYPGQAKRRKKCTATLTIQAVEVAGPNGLAFRVPWEVVGTIEAQNADEARFRMNTKVHRDATALVLECDQDVTVLLEARDCPTIPLRGAIAQLVVDLPVVVV